MTSVLLPFAALFIDVLIIVVFYSKKPVKNAETKVYSILVIVNLLDCIFNVVGIMLIRLLDNMTITAIIQKIDIGLIILWAGLLLMYFYNISEMKKRMWIKNLIIGVTIFISLLVQFVPITPVITDNAIDSSGLAPNLAYMTVGIYVVLIFILDLFSIIKNKDRNNKDKNIKYIPLYTIIISFIFCFIIRMQIPELIFEPFIMGFGMLIMYFTIENPDIKMIEALNEAKLEAEKANRAKSDFLSNMSHEIRTPLNAIVGFSDCILEEKTLDEAKNDANDIKLASENLLEIVNGILDISKIEADKMEIVETDYDIQEILANVVKLVKPRIGEKPIDMVVKFAPDLPYMLHGDGGKLRQIVMNLLTNAIKYTEEGSVVFFVNCVNNGGKTNLIISVEDTGRGIKTEQIDKLFTKFDRLEEDRNTTLEGTGLGLAITKRFVELMGGKIVVQSKYGEGSKFTVYLKQQIVAMNKATSDIKKIDNNEKNKLIDYRGVKALIVDDNKINIKVALKILAGYGINAESSESGFDCLEKLKSGKEYDIIFLDDMMPKMSGVETLKELRKINGNVPVVALTANALTGMKEKYLSDGFNDYLSKPIDKDELYRILGQLIK